MTDITDQVMPGSYAAAHIITGSSVSAPAEPMEEVSDVENGNPRYTVYQITNDDKQNLDKLTVPTFEYQVGGTGDWTQFTSSQIREIQYPGGRVVLETARASNDVVRMKTGKYFLKKLLYGTLTSKVSEKVTMKDATPLGSTAKKNFPVLEEFNIDLDVFANKALAQLVANDITLTHTPGGTAGNSITYVVTKGSGTAPLSITVTVNAIAVVLATTSGTITTTNQELRALLNTTPEVMRLGVVAECDFEDQDDVAAIFSIANLAGGLVVENYSTAKGTPVILTVYGSTTDNIRWEGYGYIEEVDTNGSSDDIIKMSLKFSNYGKIYYRPR